MVRSTYGPPSRQKRNRRLKLAKGYWGGRHRLWRTVAETLTRALHVVRSLDDVVALMERL